MNPFAIDIFEPPQGEMLFKQIIDTVLVAPLNSEGKPDYYWVDITGKSRGWERKQLGEALPDLDAVEEQLNEELMGVDELTLVVEGVGLPSPTGMDTYQLTQDQNYFRKGFHVPPGRPQPGLVQKFERWKWSLRMIGINVVETSHYLMTVQAIAAHYFQTNKLEHSTMRRYLSPHITAMDKDPDVENLMRLKGANLGQVRAKALIARFGTFFATVTADGEELAKILGPAICDKFINAIGRDY